MIDRCARNAAAGAIEDFLAERSNSFDFDEAMVDIACGSEDPLVQAVQEWAWYLEKKEADAQPSLTTMEQAIFPFARWGQLRKARRLDPCFRKRVYPAGAVARRMRPAWEESFFSVYTWCMRHFFTPLRLLVLGLPGSTSSGSRVVL